MLHEPGNIQLPRHTIALDAVCLEREGILASVALRAGAI